MADPAEDPVDRHRPDLEVGGASRSTPRFLFTVDGDHPDALLSLVCSLVADAEAELLIGYPVVEREHPTLATPDSSQKATRVAAEYVLSAKQHCEGGTVINSAVKRGERRDALIQSMIETNGVSTFITQEHPRSGIRSLLGFDSFGEAAIPESCDTIVVGQIGQQPSVDSVLVPVGRGPHSAFAIETGLALARQNEASLELLHVTETGDETARAEGETVLATAHEKLEGYEPAEQTLIEADDVEEAIVEYSRPFDVTVFGAPDEGHIRQSILGSVPKRVEERATGTILIAHRGGATDSWVDHLL